VEGTMEYDPVQFSFKRGLKLPGILLYSINTYINFSVYRLTRIRKAKSDNIRIIIVFQILSVYFQEIIIRAKYIANLIQFVAFLFKEGSNKRL
jgi:hypothetical protein